MKNNRLESQKAKDLVYVHSNLHLVSRRGEEYTSGPHKVWDVDPECTNLELSGPKKHWDVNPKCTNLELSLAALNISSDASGSGATSSSNPSSNSTEQKPCSIFVDEDEDEMDM